MSRRTCCGGPVHSQFILAGREQPGWCHPGLVCPQIKAEAVSVLTAWVTLSAHSASFVGMLETQHLATQWKKTWPVPWYLS